MNQNIPIIILSIALAVLVAFSLSCNRDLNKVNQLVEQAETEANSLSQKASQQEQLMKSKEEQSKTYARQAAELKAKLATCK